MSREKRLNRTQELDGSSPFSSTKVNNFRNNDLARPAEPAISRRRTRVSSSASSSRREPVSIHSHQGLHDEEKLHRHGVHESNLARSDRRAARRADPDDREVGTSGQLPGSEVTHLGPSDSLRSKRSECGDREEACVASEAHLAAQDLTVAEAPLSCRTQRRVVGLS